MTYVYRMTYKTEGDESVDVCIWNDVQHNKGMRELTYVYRMTYNTKGDMSDDVQHKRG